MLIFFSCSISLGAPRSLKSQYSVHSIVSICLVCVCIRFFCYLVISVFDVTSKNALQLLLLITTSEVSFLCFSHVQYILCLVFIFHLKWSAFFIHSHLYYTLDGHIYATYLSSLCEGNAHSEEERERTRERRREKETLKQAISSLLSFILQYKRPFVSIIARNVLA